MTNQACAVCLEERTSAFQIWFDGYLKLYRCRSCGFVSQFPGPGNAKVRVDYQNAYTLDFVQKGQKFRYPQRADGQRDMAQRLAKRHPGGRLLDVGCGEGMFIDLCREIGLDAIGVESDRTYSRYAVETLGLEVIKGDYRPEMFPAESFDAISMIQVLEHIPEPRAALETIKYHLKPGGSILIEVPSITAPNFLAYRATGVKWFVRPPAGVIHNHFAYFSPQSLHRLMKEMGFVRPILVTGRWQFKYHGWKRQIGQIADPILNQLRIGGLLMIATKP